MSAGGDHPSAESLVVRSFDALAPKFRSALTLALKECNDQGYDAFAYETTRSDELQQMYWARGRPPTDEYPEPVTNARSAQYGWHFFGLASDIISQSHRWTVTPAWRSAVNDVMRKHGLDCGADWPHPDLPHVQWGTLKRSPSDEARRLYAEGGNALVWRAVGAT